MSRYQNESPSYPALRQRPHLAARLAQAGVVEAGSVGGGKVGDMLDFRVPEYDKAKWGRLLVSLEWCFDGPNNTLGYVQVTPMTNGDLPLAHKIAALPQLIEVCEEIAKKPYPDSDLASLLETLRSRAELALSIASPPKV